MAAGDETIPGQLDDLRESVERRFKAGDERMGRMEASLKTNTDATQRIEANTSGLLEWFGAFEGAFKVLNGIGKLAKPVSYIVGLLVAVASAWVAFRSGGRP